MGVHIVNDNTRNDFSKTNIWVLILLGTVDNIIIFVYFLLRDLEIRKKTLIIATAIALCSNCYMIFTNIYQSPTFTEKNIMKDLKRMKLESKYIVGTFALGYTLYNDYIPILNSYEGMKNVLVDNPEYYYLDYSMKNNIGVEMHIDSILENTDYCLKEVYTFSREFQTFGEKRNMALYKVEKREVKKTNEKD